MYIHSTYSLKTEFKMMACKWQRFTWMMVPKTHVTFHDTRLVDRVSFTLLSYNPNIHGSGQIIVTSHDLTPNGGLVREIPLFQKNLGW